MSAFRDRIGAIDPCTWPAFDHQALRGPDQAKFRARRLAIEHYLAGAPLRAIEQQTGVHRRQLYRCLARCLMTHSDGRPWGWRALAPYTHIKPYERTKPVVPRKHSRAGAAGAFCMLLRTYPALSQWLSTSVRRKRLSLEQISTDDGLRTRLSGVRHLHSGFLNQCRQLGLTARDYPLNTDRLAIRSLAGAAKRECLRSFGEGARLAGAQHLKGMPSEYRAPPATAPLQVVEFDGHRLDVRLKIVVSDPLGFEQSFEIERIWLLVIIDVYSRAVLGYHVSLNREYSRHDVIRTVEAALEPHRPRTFTVPGLQYGPADAMPSGKFPQLGYATWQWMKLDNAKANLSHDVRHTLGQFVGCFIDAGPAHSPDDRPYIERFFRTVGTSLSSRLPGYTGSNLLDVRRALADPKGNLRLYVSLTEIEQLLAASIASYNATPHDGLNGRTPLEAIEHGLDGAMLNWLPQDKRRTLCLMHTPRHAKVRGYLHQGQRPHINFHGVRYTNSVLASTSAFLGQSLRIYYSSQDLRTIRAFTAEGAEIGVLTAQGAWGVVAHDLKLRQEIVRLRGRKQLESALSPEFLERFIAAKITKARGKRRAASDLAQTLRTLSGAPTITSPVALTARPAPKPTPDPQPPDKRSSDRSVTPQTLTIGTGYVGTL